ncbi:MAG: hypothetical protein K2O65_04550 [Lachnospiraceae bacterium]|nr:hypothetical protein [Lachnospiraceae bacterium]
MLTKMENTYAYCNNTEAASGSGSMDKTAAGSQTESGGKTNRSAAEYTRTLQKKYSYMNTGTTSMKGIPTTVSVSHAFLQKCANDPEKAKYLEENLAALPDCVKSLKNFTKTMPGSPTVTYAAYFIDENGNITAISGCTNDPDGKIARENAERMAKEKKEQEEKLAKRQAEQKAEERHAEKRAVLEKLGEESAEGERFTVSADGADVRSVTQRLMSASLGMPTSAVSGFSARA